MNDNLPILMGTKVRLRPMNMKEDYIAWFNIMQDERMHQFTGNVVPKTYEEVKQELYVEYPKYFLIWMIEDLDSNQVIGMMRISHPCNYNNKFIAGDSQRLHSNYWRKGHMKECRQLIYEYVFNVLNVEELYADVWEGNMNSAKSLESVGYQLYDVKEEYFKKYDKTQKKFYYKLTSQAWKVKNNQKKEIVDVNTTCV